MPPRSDIKSIMLIGSGPIVIGQACEFDYSGTQALRALKKLGYRIILVNSNPATIMTDPHLADATYIEPLTIEYIEEIIKQERPDAMLPTMGGQTALNIARTLHKEGILQQYGVELIGAKFDAIDIAEDRGRFADAMKQIGLDTPKGGIANNLEEAIQVTESTNFPVIIRPAYTLGGSGGSIAYNKVDFKKLAEMGLEASPVKQILVEESLVGWKEYELEVMRDSQNNVVIVCSIENFDPLGVHTGDSITVAPAVTLTDKEYQLMRDAAIEVIGAVGVDTGGSNIQFGLNPNTGRMVIIEMNPRVSRSSALASKATGYPIAKIAAQLAVGMTLGEISNEITGTSVSAFEPTLDYIIVKFPRWAFEKFPGSSQTLGSQMKSIGEVMAMGRTFNEALQKSIRGLDNGRHGLGNDGGDYIITDNVEPHTRKDWEEFIVKKLRSPEPNRIFFIRYAIALGFSDEVIYQTSFIDPWFIQQIRKLFQSERETLGLRNTFRQKTHLEKICKVILEAKREGFSDQQLSYLLKTSVEKVRTFREVNNIKPVYRTVDTCSGEFKATTPYFYSTYGEANEAERLGDNTIVILGSGPNRIGQGIEFDYCCVQAVWALQEKGFKVVMINNNPETVSTDYDIADRLYFEPITSEDVIEICKLEQPLGVILQFGGGTPLKLAKSLKQAGIPIIGTSQESIDLAEDRGLFAELLKKNNIMHPPYGLAETIEDAIEIAEQIGFPVLVRPSYVLGGRAMEIVYDNEQLREFFQTAIVVSSGEPILVDRYLEQAIEFDVDAISDGEECLICGVMQHIEEAGIHSGDSACVLPAQITNKATIQEMIDVTKLLAKELQIKGLLNIQFALKENELHVLEVNPRASRTVPFVSKATGIAWAKYAARVMAGEKLSQFNLPDNPIPKHISIKAVTFPFTRFGKVNYFLGPEMRSTGEVMGIGNTFGEAFSKAQSAIGSKLPQGGGVFISVNDKDKNSIIPIAKGFVELGFTIYATAGTHNLLSENKIPSNPVFKVNEGRLNIVDHIKNGIINIVINTPLGKESRFDERSVGLEASLRGIPNITTLSGAKAAIQAILFAKNETPNVVSLQDRLRA